MLAKRQAALASVYQEMEAIARSKSQPTLVTLSESKQLFEMTIEPQPAPASQSSLPKQQPGSNKAMLQHRMFI